MCLAAAASTFSRAPAAVVTAATGQSIGVAGWALRLVAAAYALAVIPLGLMDMGSANMFSSLRMHGGSNHFFLPTNLLQWYFIDAPPDRCAAPRSRAQKQ